MATRKRTIPRAAHLDKLGPAVEEYLQNRSMRERSEYHEGKLKKDLMAVLEVSGEQVDPAKQTLELDIPLPYTQYKGGKPVIKKVTGIERRKRTSNVLDEEKALKLLARKKLLEECTEQVIVLNEDKLLAANYAGKITDKELAALYDESDTYAFYLTEDTASA